MKLVKSLLLGSAAGLCAVAGAQAADLPYRKAEAVEYVRVCSAYGAGFFFIPGTDTCIRVGGRARFEYNYTSGRSRAGGLQNGSPSGYLGLGQLNLDSRTQTSYGTLRAFVRFIIAGRTGGYMTSGTAQRFAQAYPALGQDTFGLSQQYTNVDKAFVQFAGFTAGRASSFFDFYVHDVELIGGSAVSNTGSTNLFAYTATFGNGFSATLSAEDPTQRRQPVFASGVTFNPGATGANFATLGATFTSAVPLSLNGAGVYGPYAGGAPAGYYTVDVQQKNEVPDFVAALRWDQPWGSLQVMGASHQLTVGRVVGAFTPGGAAIAAAGTGGVIAASPSDEYGWAVGAGAKINLPMIAAGDVLWIQAAYAEGALSYTGFSRFAGYENATQNYSGRFTVATNDAVLNAFGKLKLSESASVTAAFLHYWNPQLRSAVFGSYSGINYSKSLRSGAGPFGTIATTTAQANTLAFSPLFKDFTQSYVGANLIWSPVRDLDIGVEAVYTRIDIDGRVADANKGITTPATGIPLKTVSYDDVFMTRFRVQRDF